MARIGPITTVLSDRMRQLMERNAAERAERLAAGAERWGWPPDAACEHCGDTGVYPDTDDPCWCAVGQEERNQRSVRADIEARWDAAVPVRFRRYRLDGAPNVAAAKAVRGWLDLGGGGTQTVPNLFLHGPVGTGKTGLAVGAMRALIERGMVPKLWGVPTLLDRMRPGGDDDDPLARCVKVSVLVLDDLGVEKPSEWVRERLYVLLNGRYEAERPTIVTSNVDLVGLAAQIGERAVSRFAERVTVVKVFGTDLRRL